MIDPNLERAIRAFEIRSNDALGAGTPGYEPSSAEARLARPRLARDPSDVSIVPPRESYLIAGSPGSYSRAGVLRFDDSGRLLDGMGRQIYGYRAGDVSPTPLSIPVAAARAGTAKIDADGVLSFDDLAASKRTIVGRIALVRAPFGTRMIHRRDGSITAPLGTQMNLGVPNSGGFAPLKTHVRDFGSVDRTTASVLLTKANALMDALMSAHTARASIDRTAMELLK